MDPIIKDHGDPSHIWTKDEIIECGICSACDEEEPEFERDEVNDIISVGAQDEYDVDPDVLTNDANDVDHDGCLPFIHEEKEETQEPTVEPVQEPAVVELVIEHVLQQVQHLEVQEEIIESDINLPFNIEKKEEKDEKDEKEEDEEKCEPVTNKVIENRLALDESIIQESAPKNIDVDENNLPFIHEEKEETQEPQEPQDNALANTVEGSANALDGLQSVLQLDDTNVDNILPIIDNEQEEKEDMTENEELTEDRVITLRRDIATFEAPPAKKFKWKSWFQSLWFWT